MEEDPATGKGGVLVEVVALFDDVIHECRHTHNALAAAGHHDPDLSADNATRTPDSDPLRSGRRVTQSS